MADGAERKLTERQKRFIDYYIESGNATEAARRAGYRGKNDHVFESIGSENLCKLEDIIRERLNAKEDERIAKQDEVLRYLTAVMRREYRENVVVTLKEEESTYVPDDEGVMRKQTIRREVPEVVEIPAMLKDANKAAELLGKRYCLFTDKVEIDGAAPVQIIDDFAADESDSSGRIGFDVD